MKREEADSFKRNYLREKEKYEKEAYYEIFPGLSEYKKQPKAREEEDSREENMKALQEESKKEDPLQKNRSLPVASKRVDWADSIRKPSNNYRKEDLETKTYKVEISKPEASRHYDSIYSTKKSHSELEEAYIFNSGPLIDDPGNGSDFEDYFEVENADTSEIEDEEIKVHQDRPTKKSISEYESIKAVSAAQSQHSIL